ncbi:asparagine synthase (glutamine-hydrolyzing) [Candidatus Methanophagaceae archaeon]|nr:asparagine synthase (glutamine-hydrolyzing) [Methanophagales archaeon]
MPGIVGIISSNVDNELLEQMISSLRHEKWYKVDKYLDSFFGIARVHLGIFNPEPQPIFNEDKSLCIFMDGKIYGYDDEMNELKSEGYKFSVGNDPEFCLHIYEYYGIDFVKKINGDFVIAICDLKEEKLLLANDRYGLRPHYYAINNGKLLFTPEVKAILLDKNFKKELNDETVADFFAFGEILGNKTFLKGIEVLPPASILTYDRGIISIKQYWDFNYEPDYSKTEDEFVDELVETFKKAVAIRMKDNYRYGVALSGGLDSRSVVAAIEKDKRKDVFAFTFGPLDCNEVKIAKNVADIAGMKHKIIEITPELIIDNAENEILYSDGMDYIGVSFIPPVCRVVKDNNNIDVVFDGFAFDLTLGGSYLTDEIVNTKNKDELLKILYAKQRFFSEIELNKLFIVDYYNKIRHYPLNSFEKEFKVVKETHPGNCCDYLFLQNHVRRWTIGGQILERFCIEDSVPTYDNNLIDVILKIPPELRLNHCIYRKFLKKLSPELASFIYDKNMIRADAPLILWKAGAIYQRIGNKLKRQIWKLSKGKIFIPGKRTYVEFNDWLRTNENWKIFFKDLLLDKNAMSKTYFNQDYIKTLIREHEKGKKNNAQKILYLASFELFLRLFMNKDF